MTHPESQPDKCSVFLWTAIPHAWTHSLCPSAPLPHWSYFLRPEGTPSDAIGSLRLIRASVNANGMGFGDITGGHLHGLQTERGVLWLFPQVYQFVALYVIRFALPVLPYALQIFDCACLLSVLVAMTLICLQLISPSMHACVHVGECMCVCIHSRMFTYLSSQQHPHNQLILSHFWKQLPFSFLRVDQWRVFFR